MKSIMQLTVIGLLALVVFILQPAWAATNISSTYKYAWSENVGWQNWNSTNAQATVGTTYLVGYVWAENIGWIKLGGTAGPSGSPPQYLNSDQTNYGVNRNSTTGALSGYGWSENAGWINFSATTYGPGVTMVSDTFDGYAWAENVGYIHFQNSSPSYYVELDGPLVVDLVSFTAKGFEDFVQLKWNTATEIDTAGFHLWRGNRADGDYARITDALIPAEGGPALGAAYSYTDTNVSPPQVWYYKLEDLDSKGKSTFHGPVMAVVGDAALSVLSGGGTIPDEETASGIGSIEMQGVGQHTVITGRYEVIPAGVSPISGGAYWFVDVSDPAGVDEMTIQFCPADPTDTVYYWNGSTWIACSVQSHANGCIGVTITDSSRPAVADMGTMIFALGQVPAEVVPTLSEWGMALFFLFLGGSAVLVMRKRNCIR